MYKKKETRNSWYILLPHPSHPPTQAEVQPKPKKKRLYVMYNRSITIQTSFFCPEKKSRALNNASNRLRNKKETTTKCCMLKAPNIELVAKQRPQPTSARLQFKGRINLPPLAPNVENKETHFAVLVVRTLAQIMIPPCLRQQNTSPISFFLSLSLPPLNQKLQAYSYPYP